MFKSLLGVVKDVTEIAVTPIGVVADLTRAVTKPVAEAVSEVADDIKDSIGVKDD